jgi:hypothetical protein
VKRILLPLAIYLAITLGIPIANGAAARSEFWHHATEVLLVAALLTLSLAVGRRVSKPARKARSRLKFSVSTGAQPKHRPRPGSAGVAAWQVGHPTTGSAS